MVLPVFCALSLLPLLVLTHPTPHPDGSDCGLVKRSLPGKWYHEPGHPVEKLFARQGRSYPTDGTSYPAVGTPEWSAGFPPAPPDSSKMPQAWINALNEAVNAGKIPNISPSMNTGGTPNYPSGVNPVDPSVCSWSYGCRDPNDINNAPDGVIGIAFDDGPSLGSGLLYDFLEGNHIPATHFMIGINILNNPALFTRAFVELDTDIAVHTWTHRYSTTLSNMDMVAEFGWSIQLIKNSTGGRLPRYWRPPYGDVDNRIRAIAKEIFGLETIIWNHDTLDWSLTTGGTTPQAINASMTQWLTGPKSPGLLILEHELTTNSAQAFIDAYPLITETGWEIESATRMEGETVYQNSQDGDSPVQPYSGVLGANYINPPSSSSMLPSSTSTDTPHPTPSNTTTNNNSSSSVPDKNGSSQPIVSKYAGALGAIFLTMTLCAW